LGTAIRVGYRPGNALDLAVQHLTSAKPMIKAATGLQPENPARIGRTMVKRGLLQAVCLKSAGEELFGLLNCSAPILQRTISHEFKADLLATELTLLTVVQRIQHFYLICLIRFACCCGGRMESIFI